MTKTELEALQAQRSLRRALDGVELGKVRRFGGLSVWPLLGGRRTGAYALLDEALEAETAEVTELDGGRVPELRFVNRGERPVLLADGEELLGAMQNRSLNLSILAPAQAELTIPVSCMESGRWSYRGEREFRHSGHVMNARVRMRRMDHVSESLRSSAGLRRASNQGEVWEEIDRAAESLGSASPTAAMHDAFEHHGGELEDYERALRPRRRACGAVFAIDGGAHGLDLFDARSTFQSLYPKLLRSWSLDAIAAARSGGYGPQSAQAVDPRILLDRLARRRCRVYPGVGLGVDARLARRGSRLRGAALIVDDAAVHVSAFHSGFET